MKMTIAATLAQKLCHSTIGCFSLYVFGAKKTLNPSVIKAVPRGGPERYTVYRLYAHTVALHGFVPLISNLQFLFSLKIATVTCIHARIRRKHARTIPCDLLQIQSPVRITRSALKKNYLLSFQQSIFNLRCSRAYSKSQALRAVWKKKAFSPYMFNSKVIDNM